ncbi:MAG: bifunctional phosphoribosylaminoimidazolecarboxamide formyltransferase/IMP cyclohydrolase [Firmicutes bacterium]|nr:bifunctional phosphoribosylaminoimidazolecarboxamide formyltransferase/IMP cyclohydrolase [Bacillota bacterium]MDH7496453.1 bifunctional phosphoribosylaminoimidazolecarboxamide formyltransferase/IMP cyclohydrolase [Bacillota bacterium]
MGTRRAIISVHDKTGVVEFAKALAELGYEIVSTGGTAAVLEEAGVPVTPVSTVTGFPEILGGRVKTLHPAVHAGILARRTPGHEGELRRLGIEFVDIVAVNLYPFVETVAKPGVTLEEAVENIDIGGPTMVRAAAKNFERVTVVTSPSRYAEVVAELESQGQVSLRTRMRLAAEAFRHTSEYDRAVTEFLGRTREEQGLRGEGDKDGSGCHGTLQDELWIRGAKVLDLRYGENPHQAAAFYALEGIEAAGLAAARQVQGKALSFNNILDADAALRIMREFSEPVAVVIKHTNPCGVAVANDLANAYVRARDADSVSAFGSVVGLGGTVTADVAARLVETFVEVVLAWGVADEALPILATKPNLRVLVVPGAPNGSVGARAGIDVRWVDGGFLVQQADVPCEDEEHAVRVVTCRRPSVQEAKWLLHAMRVAKHVKSNAIVLWKDGATVGVGAGQMNRVGSVRIAAAQAGAHARGAVLASDAFFPFRDGIDEAARAGVTAIVQPGGSLRDKECIEAANEHGISMVFTGIRHFRH